MNGPSLIGVQAAVRALDRKGTVADLARLLGISRVAVLNWHNNIPIGRVADVSRVTGVPREVLRPDFIEEIKKLGVPEDVLRPSLLRKRRSKGRKVSVTAE